MVRVTVQLIQNYLKQEIPTIILTIQKQKYIFNVPTCFQRFIKDHRQKFPKGSVIFFTKATTDTLAGLNGFMLSIFETKLCQQTKLYVNNELYNYLQEVRYKMGFKILPYSYSNLVTGKTRTGIKSTEKVYQLLQKQNYAQLFLNSEKFINESLSADERNESKKHLNERNQYSDSEIKIIPFQIQSQREKITNYICIPNKLQGRVLPNKIKQFKIPSKLISKLLAEGAIQLQDGNVVKAQQIKQADLPSPNFLIFHYNSIEAIQKILVHDKFQSYLKDASNVTDSFIHIIQNPELQNIVESKQFLYLVSLFSKDVKHIVYNRNFQNKIQNYDLSQEPVPKHVELVSFVNKYFPEAMPNILDQHLAYIQNHLKHTKYLEDLFPENKMIAYRRCYELVLAPKKSQGYIAMGQGIGQKQKQKRQYVVPEGIIQGQQFPMVICEEMAKFKQINPQVVFLGTGSMKPSKYRNVSSIYVEMTQNYSFVFDCGEGSYYQLFNHFGQDKIDQSVMRIKTIFITHIHSDHNLGILDLISQRNKLLRKKYQKYYGNSQQYQKIISNQKLVLIIPYNVLPWFQSFVANIQNLIEGCDILFVQTLLKQELQVSNATTSKDEKIVKPKRTESEMKDEKQESDPEGCEQQNQQLQAYFSPFLKKLLEKYAPQQNQILQRFQSDLLQIGVTQFLPVHVDHCPQSFAIVVTHKSGVKISYSGDCRPSQQFAKAAHKSTLMIHQATFGDDLQSNAIQNMHTTVGEAIDLAIKSESWKLALTHFSQRYISAKQIVDPSLYKLNEVKRVYAKEHSIVCFDHLRMRMDQLPLLVYQSRKICQIFPSDSLQ